MRWIPATAVDEIMETYIEGWRLGLKAIAIYRDGSKRSAPLNTRKTKDMGSTEEGAMPFREGADTERRVLELEQEVTQMTRQVDLPGASSHADTRWHVAHRTSSRSRVTKATSLLALPKMWSTG